jgi:hypothetical protein
MILPLVVIIASAAAVSGGIYLTVRGFRASEARAAAQNGSSNAPADTARTAVARHDLSTIELLKRFFDGKECAVCKRAIPPVRTGPKPGLLNPSTHETYSWDQIPHDNLSSLLETQVPLCPACQVAESFRQRHPDLVVDRDRPHQGAHAADRIPARS